MVIPSSVSCYSFKAPHLRNFGFRCGRTYITIFPKARIQVRHHFLPLLPCAPIGTCTQHCSVTLLFPPESHGTNDPPPGVSQRHTTRIHHKYNVALCTRGECVGRHGTLQKPETIQPSSMSPRLRTPTHASISSMPPTTQYQTIIPPQNHKTDNHPKSKSLTGYQCKQNLNKTLNKTT